MSRITKSQTIRVQIQHPGKKSNKHTRVPGPNQALVHQIHDIIQRSIPQGQRSHLADRGCHKQGGRNSFPRNVPNSETKLILVPVSYTHLDVYKRQI